MPHALQWAQPEEKCLLHLQETINNRLAMLGVVTGLAAEFGSGMGIKQQIAAEPLGVLATFVIFAYATYIPIMRGYTRKEPFENAIFSAKVGAADLVSAGGWSALIPRWMALAGCQLLYLSVH